MALAAPGLRLLFSIPAQEDTMEINRLKQSIDRVEQCADEAKKALYGSSAPPELRECVDEMHQQALQAQQAATAQQQQQAGDHGRLHTTVQRLEQTGDRAVQACRHAGNVDPQLQQAVQRAHDEISKLKRQMQ
jgi:uncharacterized protein Yka (UPF0111/DUF47 family)